jgi:hypothetical protein
MGKNTRKPAAPRKSKYNMLPVSSPAFLNLVKRKLIRKTSESAFSKPHPEKIDSLVN